MLIHSLVEEQAAPLWHFPFSVERGENHFHIATLPPWHCGHKHDPGLSRGAGCCVLVWGVWPLPSLTFAVPFVLMTESISSLTTAVCSVSPTR